MPDIMGDIPLLPVPNIIGPDTIGADIIGDIPLPPVPNIIGPDIIGDIPLPPVPNIIGPDIMGDIPLPPVKEENVSIGPTEPINPILLSPTIFPISWLIVPAI